MRPLGAASTTLEAQRDQVPPSASRDQVVILQVVDQAAGGFYCLHLFGRPRRARARSTVLYENFPRPRRSISAATFCGDRCGSSRRTGSIAASRSAAAMRLLSAIAWLPSLAPLSLAACRPGGGALAFDHPPFLLGQGRVDNGA